MAWDILVDNCNAINCFHIDAVSREIVNQRTRTAYRLINCSYFFRSVIHVTLGNRPLELSDDQQNEDETDRLSESTNITNS